MKKCHSENSRGEFEDYIKRTNPTGYMETSAVPALVEIGAH